MRAGTVTLWIAIWTSAVGCAARPSPGVHTLAVNTYAFGIFGGRAVDLRDVCGATPATRMEIRRRGLDYVISAVSLGFYMPHEVRIRCGVTAQ